MWNVLISLYEGTPHQIVPMLDDKELYAVGRLTVSWAHMEHLLFLETLKLADAHKLPLPTDAARDSFIKRLRAWRALAVAVPIDDEQRSKILSICVRMGNIERSRHRITHGVWEYSHKNPDKLRNLSFRPGREFQEPFDFEKIMTLCERVGAINFELVYPGGKDQAYAESLGDQPYVSREFLRRVQAASRERPRPAQPRPEAEDSPQE